MQSLGQKRFERLERIEPFERPLSVLSVERSRRENLPDVESSIGQPLLNRVTQQRLKCNSILLDRIRPGIRTKNRHLLLLFGYEEGLGGVKLRSILPQATIKLNPTPAVVRRSLALFTVWAFAKMSFDAHIPTRRSPTSAE